MSDGWDLHGYMCTQFGLTLQCSAPRLLSHHVRDALLAKGPDSSLGEMQKGSCSENIHMEEEKVEFKVQQEEVEDGRDK